MTGVIPSWRASENCGSEHASKRGLSLAAWTARHKQVTRWAAAARAHLLLQKPRAADAADAAQNQGLLSAAKVNAAAQTQVYEAAAAKAKLPKPMVKWTGKLKGKTSNKHRDISIVF